jgi:hypothetical protein
MRADLRRRLASVPAVPHDFAAFRGLAAAWDSLAWRVPGAPLRALATNQLDVDPTAANATTTMTITTRRRVAPTTIARHPGRFLCGAMGGGCADAARDDSGRYHLPSDACHHPGP